MFTDTQRRNAVLAGVIILIVAVILGWSIRGHEDRSVTHQDVALRTNFEAAAQLSCTRNEHATLTAQGRSASDDAIATYCACTTRKTGASMTDDELRAYSQPGVTLPPSVLARVQDIAKTCPQP